MAWRSYADASRMDRLTCAPTRETAARQQWRVTVESPELAARIFDRLRPLLVGAMVEGGRGGGQSLGASGGGGGGGWDGVVASAIGCAPNLRLYRYEVGDAFGRHVDESGEVPLEGGETVFYRGSYGNSVVLRYAPAAGALLAHAHGEACLPHEAAKVVAGVKYVLRTDVVVAST